MAVGLVVDYMVHIVHYFLHQVSMIREKLNELVRVLMGKALDAKMGTYSAMLDTCFAALQ